MKQRFTLLVAIFLFYSTITAQTNDTINKPARPSAEATAAPAAKTPLFGISFSGFVNTSIFFDTRQTVMARDGQWLFYPENVRPDAEGNDLNAKGTFNILSIESRVSGNITGPDIFGAKSSGLIEGEFYGNINANINSFRLRHAYVKLTWKTTELLVGQSWHPMFVPACYPEVISLNTGAPFLVFSRNPQVRISQQVGPLKLQLAAISQLDAVSNGPEGPSPKYLRNSIVPEFNFQVQYFTKSGSGDREFLAGASVDFLMLTPRLGTEVVLKPAYDTVVNNIVEHHNAVTANYRTNAKSVALAYNVFAKLRLKRVSIKMGAVYGNDCYAFNMIGGYAVKEVVDPLRGTVEYAQISTGSVWLDIKGNGARWVPGIFGGFTKNLGAGETVTGPYYSRGANIDYVYRCAPRIALIVKKLRIAAEVDYTVAAYGDINTTGGVSNSHEVGNVRFLLGVYYNF